MVLQWKGVAVVGVLLLASLLAGCTGGDPDTEETPTGASTNAPDEATSEGDETTPDTPAPTVPPTDTLDIDSAIFAPTWAGGDSWTYTASGVWHPEGVVTVQVVEDAGSHYVMGSDSDVELAFNWVRQGPLIARDADVGIDKETLAFVEDGESRDLFGFERSDGATWDVTLFDLPFTLTKTVSNDVQGPNGNGRGLVVTGTSASENTLTLTYLVEAGWFTLFEILDPAGEPLMRYTLDAFSEGAVSASRWSVTESMSVSTSAPGFPASFSDMESDGSGRTLFYVTRVSTKGDPVRGDITLLKPDGTVGHQRTLETAGEQWDMGPIADASGQWTYTSYGVTDGSRPSKVVTRGWLFQLGA